MPIVKNQVTSFRQKDGKRFVMRVYCDSTGTFSIRLPPPVIDALSLIKVKHHLFDEAVRSFHECLKRYEHMQQTKRKVIVYKISSNNTIYRGDQVIHKSDDISFCAGVAVALAAGVYEETTTEKPDGRKAYAYHLVESSLPEGIQQLGRRLVGPQEHCMPWTQEREVFFGRIGHALETIGMQLTEAARDSDLFAQFANGELNFKLLLANAQDPH